MKPRTWFSAAVRLAVIADGLGVLNEVRTIIVLLAGDFDEAFAKALTLGRGMEEQYKNGDGRLVYRRLVEIETLDLLGDDIPDGREVYSEPLGVSDPIKETPIHYFPDDSKPTQSGV